MGGYEEKVERVGRYEGRNEKKKTKNEKKNIGHEEPKPNRFITFFSLLRVPLLEPKKIKPEPK